MGKKAKFTIMDATANLCRRLSELGCVYQWEGTNSRYVYVTTPRAAKFRVSDHSPKLSRFLRDNGRAKNLFFDIGPHAMTVHAAVTAYAEAAGLSRATDAEGNDG